MEFKGSYFNQSFEITAPIAHQWKTIELSLESKASNGNQIQLAHQGESVDLMQVSIEKAN